MQKISFALCSIFLLITTTIKAADLPSNFVYLKEIDPTIVQDIRYATSHNFIGHPIAGYTAAECILTKPAATALAQVQKELKQSALSIKVYDCYRPQQAVAEFITWSSQAELQPMKAEFYPRVNKADFFKLGYVAKKSAHTRGSTIDLTIVPLPTPPQKAYTAKQKLVACFAPYLQRFADNTIDMGTGFDCLDTQAHQDNTDISIVAQHNRMILKTVMEKHGFDPYSAEWWHFTLKNEPYPDTYFNFPVVKPS
jgi:D-alanyl-D-alanine dipeptidase